MALFAGLSMLTLSGFIFNQFWLFDPLEGVQKVAHKKFMYVQRHSQKKDFKIKYKDKVSKKEITISADRLKGIEKDALIIVEKNNQEQFIPFHRVTEILYQDKTYWKL